MATVGSWIFTFWGFIMGMLWVNWIHYDATLIVEDPILAKLDTGCTFAFAICGFHDGR